ncbi:MAG: hypothetical protein PHD88_08465 [Firmicutes bacterium]|nr:hypothetical protein [Bacillota bacterium]MDD4694409.1 hypothetical protein [Bacillota bacterium]
MARQVIILHGVFSCIVYPLAFTLPNALRAAYDVRFNMIFALESTWISRLGFGILLARTFGLSFLVSDLL